MTVLFHHYLISFAIIMVPNPGTLVSIIKFTPFHIFWAGHEAVIFFFILSGFVLSLPFYKVKKNAYSKFLIKRISRIYFPYLIAVIIAFGVRFFSTGRFDAFFSDWFNNISTVSLNFKVIFDHILFIGFYKTNIIPVTWSLVQEMRISLIFPFIMWIIIRTKWKIALCLGMCIYILGFMIEYFTNSTSLVSLPRTLCYILMFIVGALLARFRNQLQNWFLNLSIQRRIFICLIGILMYVYPWLLQGNGILYFIHIRLLDEWATILGVSIIILSALSIKGFTKFLLLKPIHFLGQISYSLYLYHTLVLILIINQFKNVFPIYTLFLLSFVCSLIISIVSYYFIELPAISFGRKLVNYKIINFNK